MVKKIVLIAAIGVAAAGCSSQSKTATDTAAKPAATAATPATATAAKAETAAAPQKGEMLCERAKESRTLRLEGVQPKGCKLWYSNHGSADPVAWSDVGSSHCEQVRDRIRTNLESAGFKCQDAASQAAATAASGDKKTATN